MADEGLASGGAANEGGSMAGRTALITGASRGIGAATARAFAEAGANVVLVARDASALADLAGEIGTAALAVPCDVTRALQIGTAVDAAVETYGGLDILVNNAGVIEPVARMEAADPEAWGRVIDVNLKGVFNGMAAALPVMLESGGGTILTIGSGAAHGPVEGWSHYCASKAAVLMLTRMLHHENGGDGIRAMSLSPGTVATQMQREIKASGVNPVSELPWEAHISPEWAARALVWMAGPAGDAFLGQEVSLRDEGVRAAVGLT